MPPRTILLADDETQFRDNVAGLLQAKGYGVIQAADGLDALLTIRENRPAICVLSVLLPKIDGGRVCRLIRQDRRLRHMLVVALSSLSLEETKRFPELNADALVAKRPWKEAGQDIVEAIDYLEKGGQLGLSSGIFGFNRFRPVRVPSDLLLARRHYEMLLRGFSCAIVELDPTGRIVMANTRAADLLGTREASLIGTPLQDHLPEGDRETFNEAVRIASKSTGPEDRRIPLAIGSALSVTLRSDSHAGRCLGFLATFD